MIGDNNETEDSKSVEEGAADRRESTRKRQQTAIFDPNAWQIEADIRKNRPENPPVSSSSGSSSTIISSNIGCDMQPFMSMQGMNKIFAS
mmetsp:Transcript_31830/g.44544  ORF Transcript_31830/g.44544 Transcript_31830/m.44544 type:complete len:90 (-) Transcript_31830:539-808(-)